MTLTPTGVFSNNNNTSGCVVSMDFFGWKQIRHSTCTYIYRYQLPNQYFFSVCVCTVQYVLLHSIHLYTVLG